MCCGWLLGVRLSTAADHCGVGGGSYHRSWLAAHLVQAAARTNTAANEDNQKGNNGTNTKDHGQW